MPAPRESNWTQAYPLIEPQINAEGKHVWPFEPSFPIDVRHLIFDDVGEIRMRRHDYCELLLGSEGESVFGIQDRFVSIAPGDLLIMGTTLYHRPIPGKGAPSKAIVVYFLPELVFSGEAHGDAVQYLLPFMMQDDSFQHVIPARTGIPSRVLELIEQMRVELPPASPAARLYVKSCLKMILALLVRHYAGFFAARRAFDRKQRNIERLRPLFEFMDLHYHERISLAAAAALAHMSKSHFIRYFREVTAHPFAVYLNHFRVAKAQALLASSGKTMAEIAAAVGFCDQSHFTAVFRRFVHLTPLEYRRSVLNKDA